ncbi:MAG TPA: hypothetical protein VLA26_10085 [Gammaproteobacteria bacterium]|nr:hypothetical protein [Gammaproteobacteria bacterium]
MHTEKEQFCSPKSAVMVGVVLALGLAAHPAGASDSLIEALKGGSAKVDLRLRYEGVEQDNARKDADAMTLRTRLGYGTGEFQGFSLYGEFEDVSIIGNTKYSVPGGADQSYSIVADPEVSEVNQVYLAYSGIPDTRLQYGLQRIILDNARFVGNVGWRQNEQTFKAFHLVNSTLPDTQLTYAHLNQIHTITGTETDTDTHLLNVRYSGLPVGTLTAYGYFIEFPDSAASQKTLGLRLTGSHAPGDGMKLLYALEYAAQSDYKDGNAGIGGKYQLVELGGQYGGMTAKIGYEVLGDDDHIEFQTPLATKHAFNGWTDQFLTTPAGGLEDIYVTLGGMAMGVNLLGVYHDYSSDAGGIDYGSEWGFQAMKKFAKHYQAGLKYSSYSAGDAGTAQVDTDKLWLWGAVAF